MNDPRDAAAPAADFGSVWEALDTLPRATASASLAATTIDMVAVEAGAGTPDRGGGRPSVIRRAGPAAAVALVAGLVVGRLIAPDADLVVLRALPLVRHLELLQEAGSTRFLEEMSRRRYPSPVRLALRQAPEARDAERRRYEAELAELRRELAADAAVDPLPARRADVQALPDEERLELERAADRYLRLSAAERRAIEAVAGGLVDPARQDLRDAAARWHEWLRSARPEERPGIVARGTDERLDWLDWYSTRIDQRFDGRGNERPPRGPEGRFRQRPEPPEDLPPRGPGFDRPPPRPSRDDRPPFRPDGRPRPGPPGEPGETPAPPR